MKDLHAVPDSEAAFVPGVGEVTVGAIRATAAGDVGDEEADTLEMWARIATRHYMVEPWENLISGATASDTGE